MFNSNVLEVGIGLIFTFLAVSLITGAIIEVITSIVGWRANTLKNGIKALLNDPGFIGLARDLYAHASVNPRGPGTTAAETHAASGTGLLGFWTNKKPSYIDREQFANALMDITGMSSTIANNPPPPPVVVPPNLVTSLKAAVDEKIPAAPVSLSPPAEPTPRANAAVNPQISELLQGIIDRTLGDPAKIRAELESWFDNAMDRLSGVYKRWMQFLSFVVALVLAVALNVDAITVAKALWQQPTLTANLKPPANVIVDQSAAAREALKTLDSYLPVGWPNGFFVTTAVTENPMKGDDGKPKTDNGGNLLYKFGKWEWALAISGWLITSFATLFGAPFWFDALQRVVRLKGSGPSPEEKKTKTAAAQ